MFDINNINVSSLFSNRSAKSRLKTYDNPFARDGKEASKNKQVRKIVNNFQKKIIKNNRMICIEGRDIASKILSKNPKYDLAFYFKCKIEVASYRRWLDLKKQVSLKEVKKSLKKRTLMDKKRKHSPLIKVKDAILIRTDLLSKKQVLSKMSKYIENI